MTEKSLEQFSAAAKSIVVGGLYEHYKGMLYKVIGISRHSETLEELVIYQALYGEFGIWARPVSMFEEKVIISGEPIPRFKLLKKLI